MRDNWRKFKSLREDPDAPIYVRNVTDLTVFIRMLDRPEFICDWDHRNRHGKELRIEPNELVNLREIIHDESLHCNLILHWHITTERVIVINDAHWWFDGSDYKTLETEVANPPARQTARYHLIQAQRRRNERRDSR